MPRCGAGPQRGTAPAVVPGGRLTGDIGPGNQLVALLLVTSQISTRVWYSRLHPRQTHAVGPSRPTLIQPCNTAESETVALHSPPLDLSSRRR